MPSKPHSTAAALPVFSLLLAATLWGLIWYPLRLLEQAGLAGLWATAVSYGTALAVSLWLPVRRRRELALRPLLLLAMALAAGWCNVSFILAVLDGTVVRVLLLFYLSPAWAVWMAWMVLGEHPDRRALGVVAMALVGAVTMLWDAESGFPWPRDRADWLAVSSGFAFAVTNVLVRKMQDVSVGVKTVANWIGVLLVAGCWLLATQSAAPAVGTDVLLAAAALGLFGFVIMTVSVQYGVTRLPVHRSSVILLFELVVGAASAALLTSEVVLLREWIGGLLIVTAAWLAARVTGEM